MRKMLKVKYFSLKDKVFFELLIYLFVSHQGVFMPKMLNTSCNIYSKTWKMVDKQIYWDLGLTAPLVDNADQHLPREA